MSDTDNLLVLARRLEANEIAAWRAIFDAASAALAAQLGFGYAEQGGALLFWNRAAPSPLFNRIVGLGVFEPATDALLDALLARARAEKSHSLVHVSPAAVPAELGTQLAARGLGTAPPWLIHYRSLEDALPAVSVSPGYRIERVGPANAAAWGDALLAAWGFSPRAATGVLAITLPLVQDANTSCFAAIHESSGKIVGGGMLFISGGVAGLYADGVREEHRHHGLQDALIAARLAEAQRQGCTLACSQTLAAHPAQHNMAQAGFQIAYTRKNYVILK
jgi:GNAT superfamily N-acetyltransferase